jgi:hypothetical protein
MFAVQGILTVVKFVFIGCAEIHTISQNIRIFVDTYE